MIYGRLNLCTLTAVLHLFDRENSRSISKSQIVVREFTSYINVKVLGLFLFSLIEVALSIHRFTHRISRLLSKCTVIHRTLIQPGQTMYLSLFLNK